MENIAYGAKSAGMAGTSIAVGDDTTVMNTNPAAISKIDGRRVDMNLEMMFPFFPFQNKDATGSSTLNDTDGKHPIYLIPSAGFAYHKKDSPWYFGIGMFNEGGTGSDYGTLRVDNRFLEMLPAGTLDFSNTEYFSQFGYMKVAPTVAYKITDTITIGVSPQVGYSMMQMKMPFFMDQAGGGPMGNQPNGLLDTLFNADMDGQAWSISGKVGILYNFQNMYGFGLAYTTPADINLKGDATMIAPIAQMGGMIPVQTRMTGDFDMKIGWPQSVKAGMFMRMKQLGGMLVAVDVEWLNWSEYYDEIPVKLTSVTMNGTAQPDQEFTMKTNWKDQWVFKIGMEYPATEHFKLRMGYAYGKNPVPPEGLLIIMNPSVEHHITGGLGYEVGSNFEFNMAMIYGFNKDIQVENSHNISPDMLNSKASMGFFSTTMMVSYKW
ncbi:MAG: outer membrane protein transport protein [Syntrophales bacterium]